LPLSNGDMLERGRASWDKENARTEREIALFFKKDRREKEKG